MWRLLVDHQRFDADRVFDNLSVMGHLGVIMS
jgi:hypothetical protein